MIVLRLRVSARYVGLPVTRKGILSSYRFARFPGPWLWLLDCRQTASKPRFCFAQPTPGVYDCPNHRECRARCWSQKGNSSL